MTYSIVARDPRDGTMGVATQSQAFAVGSSVSWAIPGVGAVATQSMGEPMYGELGLHALRAGLTATEAIRALTTVDPHPERRQVGIVDARGEVAATTGAACVEAAGHLVGDGVVVLANLVRSPRVWEAMLAAYETTDGRLAGRLLAALEAAEGAGGDLRGRRSAAIEVVCAEPSGRPWHDRLLDLRVDDHPEPVQELRRLVEHTRRYHATVEAFELAMDGDGEAALAALPAEVPDARSDPDLAWWRAVAELVGGNQDEALRLAAALHEHAPDYATAARRFAPAGLLPEGVVDRLLPR
ncbi:MAG: DUF1028 domain-containing protein [Nitriliruptoraceae bacterium]